jgi:Tfp pilus assembly protein PilF
LDKIGYSIFLYDITNDAGAHGELANYYLLSDMDAHAQREVDRAIALGLNNSYIRLVSAILAFRRGHTDYSLNEFRAALRAGNGNLDIPWQNLIRSKQAETIYSSGLTSIAGQLLTRGIIAPAGLASQIASTVDPVNEGALLILAQAFYRNGDVNNARKTISELLRLNSHKKQAQLFDVRWR